MNRKTLLLGTAAVGSAIVLVLATVFALESVAWATSDPGVVAVVVDEVV